MSVVRTVLGEVDADELGIVDSHEHLMITGGPATVRDPDLLLDDVDDAIREVEEFATAGGGTIVDAMPTGCGRNVAALVEISRRTGVHIVATAGFHRPRFYDDLHWARSYPIDLLTEVILSEVTGGVDRWELSGPVVEPTAARPGVLKAATGLNAMTSVEERMLVAVAAVHLASGLPILTHAEHGTHADRQLDRLEAEGVAATSVAVSHMDRNPDVVLHRDLMQRGATLIYDGLYRERYRPVSAVAELVSAAVDADLRQRILLGGDVGRRSLRRSAGGSGIAGLVDQFVPHLVAHGVDKVALHQMLTANAAAFFALRPVGAA